MEDVKDKVKGLMKKVNNPFASSSSGKFKGQGRVLGSSPSGPTNPTPARRPTNAVYARPARSEEQKPKPSPSAQRKPETSSSSPPKTSHAPVGFDPFDPLVSSTRRARNGVSLNVFECPVCGGTYMSEEEVSEHVDSCLSDRVKETEISAKPLREKQVVELRNEVVGRVGVFLSGNPSEESKEVALKLLRNIVKEPENAKFRRIRMSNPKIKDAISIVTGGVELLEGVGFQLKQEDGEMWAAMDSPSEEQICLIREAISLLDQKKLEELPPTDSNSPKITVQQKKAVDRQVRVFFSVPESVAAKIDLPDSFYNLTAEELKREAELRKKKIADSQLLIPKSYKEKQAKASRRKYKATIIRIQFPDGVVLQGVFLPWEPTMALYEFVTSALKEPCLEYELLLPAVPKRRVVPRFSKRGERTPTVEEEDLVPSALVTFKPMETDSVVFTGLRNELLEISEPLTSTAGVSLPA